jgi:type I restriction enzyme M protein
VFKKFLEDILNNIENSKKLINNFLVLLSEKDITCPIIDNKGNEKGSKSFDKNKIELDSELKDTEHIPYEMDIEEYFKKEVLPFLPDTIYDKKVYKIGVEFNFNKEFYKEVKLRSSKEILEDIKKVDDELKKLEDELYG